MNLLDYIIIVSMVCMIIKGIMRGFIREIFSLAGVIIGICLGNFFQPWLNEILGPSLPFPEYTPLISFAFIFAVILILFNLIGWVIYMFSKKVFLGWFDRIFGACLAFVKVIIVTYLVIVMLTFFIPAKTPLIAGSKLAPWIIRSYQSMIRIISPDHYQNWKKRIVGELKDKGGVISREINDIVQHHE
jgi:membrane protein required for colicin V production